MQGQGTRGKACGNFAEYDVGVAAATAAPDCLASVGRTQRTNEPAGLNSYSLPPFAQNPVEKFLKIGYNKLLFRRISIIIFRRRKYETDEDRSL
jgi:hypothetical protein